METFKNKFPIEKLWTALDSCGIFRRGLPELDELRTPHIARVFCEVLRNNHVMDKMLDTDEDRKTLQVCFKMGWLHAAKDGL